MKRQGGINIKAEHQGKRQGGIKRGGGKPKQQMTGIAGPTFNHRRSMMYDNSAGAPNLSRPSMMSPAAPSWAQMVLQQAQAQNFRTMQQPMINNLNQMTQQPLTGLGLSPQRFHASQTQGTTMRRYDGTTTPMISASLGVLSSLGNTIGSTRGVYGAPQQMINMPGVGGQYSAQSRAPNTVPNRAVYGTAASTPTLMFKTAPNPTLMMPTMMPTTQTPSLMLQNMGGMAAIGPSASFQNMGGMAAMGPSTSLKNMGGMAAMGPSTSLQNMGGIAAMGPSASFQNMGGVAAMGPSTSLQNMGKMVAMGPSTSLQNIGGMAAMGPSTSVSGKYTQAAFQPSQAGFKVLPPSLQNASVSGNAMQGGRGVKQGVMRGPQGIVKIRNRRSAPPQNPPAPQPITGFKEGYIFRCSADTLQECMNRCLFGTNERDWADVQRFRGDTAVFLYDTTTRTLHGVFHPVEVGFKLEALAWGGRFPAQARVGVTYAAPPLSHEEFIGCLKHGQGGSGGRKGFFTPKLDPNEVSRLIKVLHSKDPTYMPPR